MEIDVVQMNINRLNEERKIWEDCLKPPKQLGAQQYSDMPHGSMNFTTMERIFPKMNEIDVKLEREELILKGMEKQKQLMNTKLKELTGTEYQVVKLKEVDNLNSVQISCKLHISDRTVRRIIAKNKENIK